MLSLDVKPMTLGSIRGNVMPGEGECQHGSLRPSGGGALPFERGGQSSVPGHLRKLRSAQVVILPVRLCTLVQAGHRFALLPPPCGGLK